METVFTSSNQLTGLRQGQILAKVDLVVSEWYPDRAEKAVKIEARLFRGGGGGGGRCMYNYGHNLIVISTIIPTIIIENNLQPIPLGVRTALSQLWRDLFLGEDRCIFKNCD